VGGGVPVSFSTLMMQTDAAGSDAVAYERVAGGMALAAGVGGVVYSVAFLGGVVAEYAVELGIIVSSIALMLGGILGVGVMVAVYRRLLPFAPGVALLGLALVAIGSAGAIVHGGFDLATAIKPPASDPLEHSGLPNPIDPRGLLTFGLTGLGLLVLAWQARRSGALPRGLGALGVLAGALLVAVYLGRLIILTPTNPIVAIPAAAAGLVVLPAFYIWLGLELRRH
jgi:hypothetical protein